MTAATSNLQFNNEDNHFIEKTTKGNYMIALNKQNIVDIALIKYGYGVNQDPKFKVFDEIEGLLHELDEYINANNDNYEKIPLVVIFYNSDHWCTLMVCKIKNAAYYADYYNTLIPDVLEAQLKLGGIIIHDLKLINDLNYKYYDSGLLALETAVTLYSKKEQILFDSTEEIFRDILSSNNSNMIENRKKIVNFLQILQIQKIKLNMLSNNLKEVLKQMTHDHNAFHYSNANVFLQFLTTFALQDHRMKLIEPEFKKYLGNIINLEDIECVVSIRKKLFYYDKTNNKPDIVKPDDLKLFINLDVSLNVNDFFRNISNYVNYILSITEGTYICDKQILRPNQFLVKDITKIGNNMEQDEYHKKIDNQLEKFVSKAFSTPSYSNDVLTHDEEQQCIFDLIVNFAPYFHNIFINRTKDLDDMRSKTIHQFYSSEKFEIKYALPKYLRENNNSLFKCCYSRFVYPLIRDLNEALEKNNKTDIQNIKEKLCNSLETFLKLHDTKFLSQQCIQTEGTSADSQKKVHCNIVLENDDKINEIVEDFFKLLLIIANERNKDGTDFDSEDKSNTQRYKYLEVEQILKIKTDLQRLKQYNQNGCENDYDTIKKSLLNQLTTDYGITKDDFDSIITLTINWNDFQVDNYNNYIDHIIKHVKILNKLQNEYKSSVQYISNKYRARKLMLGKGSLEHLINSLPLTKYWEVDISFKNTFPQRKVTTQVSPDRFVAIIYEIINNESQKPISNDINDLFNDCEFLDCLVKQGIFFPNLVKECFDFMIPLYAKIINLPQYSISNDDLGLYDHIIKKLVDEDNIIIHLQPIIKKVRCNVKHRKHFLDEICDRILEKYNKNDNIYFLNNVLEDADTANDIIGVMSKKDNKITIKILETLVDKSFVTAFHDNLKALDLLTKKNIHDAVDTLKEGNLPDELYLYWKIKYSIAHLNNKMGKTKVCYKILEALTLKTKTTDEVKPYYFLSLSYMADIQNKKNQYQKAYDNFSTLYNEFVSYILGTVPAEFNIDVYNAIINHERYKYAQRISDKYLNVLRMKNDIAYNKFRIFDDMKEQHHKDALKIHEEIHKIQCVVLGDSHKQMINIKNNIGFVSYRLGINMYNERRINEAIYYYIKALNINKEVFELKKKFFWDTHPTVRKSFKFVLNIYMNLLMINRTVFQECDNFINNNIANIKSGSTEHEVQALNIIINNIRKYK